MHASVLFRTLEGAGHGARVVRAAAERPDATVLASGSEVSLACQAAELLAAESLAVRVVSVPWRERFAELPRHERAHLTGEPAVIVAVEAGAPSGWTTLTGSSRRVLGLSRFGTSGSGEQVRAYLGLTSDALADLVRRELSER